MTGPTSSPGMTMGERLLADAALGILDRSLEVVRSDELFEQFHLRFEVE